MLYNSSINSLDSDETLSPLKATSIEAKTSYYDISNYIYVENDSELAKVASSGSGLNEDPYIIERKNITTTFPLGIYISGTSKYFVIRNCFVSTGLIWGHIGIYLEYVAAGTARIINNTCKNNSDGIKIYYSNNCTISNNTCQNNSLGFFTAGISIYHSNNCIINNNTCKGNVVGINIENSNSALVLNNSCSQNIQGGVNIINCEFIQIINNTFFDNSIRFNTFTKKSYFSYVVQNNFFDSLPIGYIINQSDILISKIYRQLILVNCINVTIRDYDNTILALNFYYCTSCHIINNSFAHTWSGVELLGSIAIRIHNNTFLDCYIGLSTVFSNSSFITNNSFFQCMAGIYLSHSSSSILTNNLCNQNEAFGIYVGYQSPNTIIDSNICNHNKGNGIQTEDAGSPILKNNLCNENSRYGIDIEDKASVINNTCNQNGLEGIQLFDFESSSVSNNTCNENNGSGIFIWSSDNVIASNNNCTKNKISGIQLLSSGSSIIKKNFCTHNDRDGLLLERSDDCIISFNSFEHNTEYGVTLSDESSNNIIYSNRFIDNGVTKNFNSQAYDDSMNNSWYDSSRSVGNCWSDYSGSGFYVIAGTADSVDQYPNYCDNKTSISTFTQVPLSNSSIQPTSISQTSVTTRLITTTSIALVHGFGIILIFVTAVLARMKRRNR
ncbi:MAG: right-handed parallel beta-helix repeat-containing protein [Promethearchaeota archaeon]